SAHQQPFSPAAGSTLPDASQPFFSPDRGRSLVTAFPSPATTPACAIPVPGSKVPTCYFAPRYLLPCPFGPSAPLPKPVRPGSGRFIASGPLQLRQIARQTAPPASTPLQDFYLPRDQSASGICRLPNPPSEPARSPLAPRSPFLSLDLAAADHRSWS